MSTKGISVLILLKIDIGKREISKSSRQIDPCRCCGKACVAVCCSCVLLNLLQTKVRFFTAKCNEKTNLKFPTFIMAVAMLSWENHYYVDILQKLY